LIKSRTKKAVVKIEAGIVVAENIIKIQTRGRTMNKKGFTLIELMIVVAIIGILAAIAIPQFSAYRIKSFNTKAKTELKGAYTACQVYFSPGGHPKSPTCGHLKIPHPPVDFSA